MTLPLFQERLSDLMMESDLSVPALAQRLGTSRSTLNRFLKGRRTPSVEFLVRLADYFHCTLDYLIGKEEVNYATTFLAPPPFSRRFLDLCEIFHVTRYEIQNKTSISMASVYTWEHNPRYPTIDNILRLADLFDCTVDFVVGRTAS